MLYMKTGLIGPSTGGSMPLLGDGKDEEPSE